MGYKLVSSEKFYFLKTIKLIPILIHNHLRNGKTSDYKENIFKLSRIKLLLHMNNSRVFKLYIFPLSLNELVGVTAYIQSERLWLGHHQRSRMRRRRWLEFCIARRVNFSAAGDNPFIRGPGLWPPKRGPVSLCTGYRSV